MNKKPSRLYVPCLAGNVTSYIRDGIEREEVFQGSAPITAYRWSAIRQAMRDIARVLKIPLTQIGMVEIETKGLKTATTKSYGTLLIHSDVPPTKVRRAYIVA